MQLQVHCDENPPCFPIIDLLPEWFYSSATCDWGGRNTRNVKNTTAPCFTSWEAEIYRVKVDLGLRQYLVAAVQGFLPQLKLQLAGGSVEVAADHCGLQLLLRLLVLLQLNPAQLQVPVRGGQGKVCPFFLFCFLGTQRDVKVRLQVPEKHAFVVWMVKRRGQFGIHNGPFRGSAEPPGF